MSRQLAQPGAVADLPPARQGQQLWLHSQPWAISGSAGIPDLLDKRRVQCIKLNMQNGFHTSSIFSFAACRVVGVAAHVVTGQERLELEIAAPLVFSCGGSLHGPALLLRSGIDVAGNVGRHLHLHPGASVAGQFSDSAAGGKIRMWEGPMMTAYAPEAPEWTGSGYGPMVSTASVSFSQFWAGLYTRLKAVSKHRLPLQDLQHRPCYPVPSHSAAWHQRPGSASQRL